MKKFLNMLLLILAIMVSFSACATKNISSQGETMNQVVSQDVPSNIGGETLQYIRENSDEAGNTNYDYKVYETYVEITWYRGLSTDVVIPDKIDGLPVKVIGPYAFNFYNHERNTYIVGRTDHTDDEENYFNITSVVFPQCLVEIGKDAFDNQVLQEVVIPDSVTTIRQGAFSNNVLLNTVVFGNSVQTIEASAFSRCNLRGEIVLPNSLKSIGYGAFATFLDYERSGYHMYNGQQYDLKTIYNPDATIVIPSSVTEIGKSAFAFSPSEHKESVYYTLKCQKGSAAVQYIDDENYPKYIIE